MGENSRYLYGDSTAFPLDCNFLTLLEEATRACTALLQADHRLAKAQHAIQVAAERADQDLLALQELFVSVEASLQPYLPAEAAQTVTEETAKRLRDGGLAARAQIEQQVRDWRDAAIRKAEASVGRDRFVREVSPLLLKSELPGTRWQLQWRSLGEDAAEAQSFSDCELGVRAQYNNKIPADSPLVKARRLQNWVETLPVHVEREGRWRKTAKRSVERLEKYFVTALRLDADGHWLTLHKSLKEGAPGFEFFVPLDKRKNATIRLLELQDSAQAQPLDDEDLPGLNLLIEALEPQLLALIGQRYQVMEIWYRDKEISSLLRPGELAEAIIEQLAPLVRELRARSSAAGELNLKVEVQDGRREELFVREQVISDIYKDLKSPHREAFSLFAFADEPGAGAATTPPQVSADEAPPATDKAAEPASEAEPEQAHADAEFDYEPMSNPEFHYEPVSDAELDIAELDSEDPEPLTLSGEEQDPPEMQDASASEEALAAVAQVDAPVAKAAAVPEPVLAAARPDPVAAMFADDEILSMGSAGVQVIDDDEKDQ